MSIGNNDSLTEYEFISYLDDTVIDFDLNGYLHPSEVYLRRLEGEKVNTELDETVHDINLEALMGRDFEEVNEYEAHDSDAQVYGLLYQVWDAFLRFKYPQAPLDLIAGWVDGLRVERIEEGEILCTYDAPVEWVEFKAYYDEVIAAMNQALLDGINHGITFTRN